jgi:exosortase/archaeosortase family protein
MEKERKKLLMFVIYFTVIYSLLSFIFLKSIAVPLINLWEYLIRSIFGDFFNYEPFIFVPVCSGVISISVYLGLVISANLSLEKKNDIKWVLLSVVLIWTANFLRLLLVLVSEKISLSLAKVVHVLSWFGIGVAILGLALITFKKNK